MTSYINIPIYADETAFLAAEMPKGQLLSVMADHGGGQIHLTESGMKEYASQRGIEPTAVCISWDHEALGSGKQWQHQIRVGNVLIFCLIDEPDSGNGGPTLVPESDERRP